MDREGVASIVERELEIYRYDSPAGTIGVPRSAERVQEQIERLRAALIGPELRPILRVPPEVPVEVIQDLWIVAIAGHGFVVFYDPDLVSSGLQSRARPARRHQSRSPAILWARSAPGRTHGA